MKWPFVRSIGILSDCTPLKFSYLQFETELKKNKKEWGRWKNTSWINISQGYLLTKGIKVPVDWEYADILFISIPLERTVLHKDTHVDLPLLDLNEVKPRNAVYSVNISLFQDCTQKACSSRGSCFLKAKTLNTIAATKGFIKKANTALKIWPDYSHSKRMFSHHYRCCKSL